MVAARKPSKRKSSRQFIVDGEGRPTAVIIPIKEYNALISSDEPSFTAAEVRERLREAGLLARS